MSCERNYEWNTNCETVGVNTDMAVNIGSDGKRAMSEAFSNDLHRSHACLCSCGRIRGKPAAFRARKKEIGALACSDCRPAGVHRIPEPASLPLHLLAAKLLDHLHDRADSSVGLVEFDVVPAVLGEELLAVGGQLEELGLLRHPLRLLIQPTR